MDEVPLALLAPLPDRAARYREVRDRLGALLEGVDDWVAALASVVGELHHTFAFYDWTGFYRCSRPGALVLGPFQGGHGCWFIPFDRGVCGAAARDARSQVVPDVRAFPGYIACSSASLSEIVVPVLTPSGRLLAVLDVDSDSPGAFGEVDREALEAIAADLGRRFADQVNL